MASRTFQFFMTLEEFSSLLWSIDESLHLSVILVRLGSNRHLEIVKRPGTIVMSDGMPADWIFLSKDKPDLNLVDATDIRPGEWGWVQIIVPREVGDILLLARIAAKSDWYDTNRKQIMDNPASLALFRKISSYFQKRLKGPIWVYDVHIGESEPRPSIKYSAGTEEWFKKGGKLMQEGVPNVGFTLDHPT